MPETTLLIFAAVAFARIAMPGPTALLALAVRSRRLDVMLRRGVGMRTASFATSAR
ncbi:hypothetical protein [Burkholderia ambifaria]|uniref:hypothetical protein n=1 Tax=Burkholderia ambifaria TaxID=152480 RepID=UPI00158C67EF|nr:hypothetical protein [Burkholderia ambifaria]